jgi:hypothetical protein
MNGKDLTGKILYVGRAQKRTERQGELKRKFDQIKQDRIQRYQVHYMTFEMSHGHFKSRKLLFKKKQGASVLDNLNKLLLIFFASANYLIDIRLC